MVYATDNRFGTLHYQALLLITTIRLSVSTERAICYQSWGCRHQSITFAVQQIVSGCFTLNQNN